MKNHTAKHAKSTTVEKCDRCGKPPANADVDHMFSCRCFSLVARWWAHRGAGVLLREAERRGLVCDGSDWDIFCDVERRLSDAAEEVLRDIQAKEQGVLERVEVEV